MHRAAPGTAPGSKRLQHLRRTGAPPNETSPLPPGHTQRPATRPRFSGRPSDGREVDPRQGTRFAVSPPWRFPVMANGLAPRRRIPNPTSPRVMSAAA